MSRLDEWRKELDEKTMQAVYEDRHSARLFNGFGPKEVGEVELPITKVTSKTLDIIKEAQDLTIEALNYYTKDEILSKLEEIKKTIKPGLTEEEVNTKLEGYYTKPTVDGKIEEVEGKVDEKLSDYYTIPQTDNKLKEVEGKVEGKVDLKLNNYYKKHEVDQKDVEIGENIKETILNTDELSHYYTQEKTNDLLDDLYGNFMFYYKKEQVDQLLADLEIPEVDLSDYYTKPEVDDKLENLEIPEVDLSDYYTKPEVDTKFNDLEIPEVDLSDYYTKPEVDTKFKNYYTQVQTDNKFKNYYRRYEIDDKLSDYYTKPEVEGKVDEKLSDYYTKPEVDTKFNDLEVGLDEDEVFKYIQKIYGLDHLRIYYYVMLDKNVGLKYDNLKKIYNSIEFYRLDLSKELFVNLSYLADNKYTYEDKQYRYLGYIYDNIYHPRENIYFVAGGSDRVVNIPNVRNIAKSINYTDVYLIYEELPPEPEPEVEE